MEDLVRLGVDPQAGIEYTGSTDKYVSALQRFYKSSDKNLVRIKDCMNRIDLENLAIVVHALKSNARMIGAAELSGMFEILEKAAMNEDMGTLRANVDKTLSEYKRLLEVIKPWGEHETYLAAGEISAQQATEIGEKLLAALDDFNDDLSAELIRKLSGYPFRITQRDKLKEAAGLVDDFMYDEAAELIREILPTIE